MLNVLKPCTHFVFTALLVNAVTVSAVIAQNTQYRAPLPSDGNLIWRLEKGQAISMLTDQSTNMTMSVAGQKMSNDNKNLNELTMRVAEVGADGTASVGITIDRMKMEVQAAGQRMQFDTSDPQSAAGPMAEVSNILQPMIGKAITQKIAPSGKIFDVEVPEDMLPKDQNNPVAAALMSKKSLEEMTSRASMEFPKSNPEMGETWQVKAELDMGPASVETLTDYTYLGVKEGRDGPVHVIEGKITMKFPQGIAGNDIEILQQDATALFFFDGIQGRLRGSELFQDMKMRISTAGQLIEQHIVQTMKTEMLLKSEND